MVLCGRLLNSISVMFQLFAQLHSIYFVLRGRDCGFATSFESGSHFHCAILSKNWTFLYKTLFLYWKYGIEWNRFDQQNTQDFFFFSLILNFWYSFGWQKKYVDVIFHMIQLDEEYFELQKFAYALRVSFGV